MKTTIPCLNCGQPVELGEAAAVGQRLFCPACDERLEVVSVDPAELDWAYVNPDQSSIWSGGDPAAKLPGEEERLRLAG